MSDAWFDWQVAPDGDPEDGCHPQEAAALKDYVQSTTVTAEATARIITLPVTKEPETDRKGQSSDNLHRLWGLIINALIDLPEHRPRIIQLLQAIQNLPTATRKEDEAQNQPIRWADLPSFGHLWADLKVSDNWRSEIRNWATERYEGVREDFIEQAKIEAQLVVAGIGGIPISWGLRCICDAFERRDAVLDFEVPAAKEWLEMAGDLIFENSDRDVIEELSERDLWKQEGEKRKQRWNFWKRRLHLIAESEEITVRIKEAAKKALEAMESITK